MGILPHTVGLASLFVEPTNQPKPNLLTDMEKVVNCPQAENLEIYNVLKVPRLATKVNQRSKYYLLVWHDEILK